jgi:hypothetical protein
VAKGKHIPQRTCVGCRTGGAKRDFVRVVRTPEGRVEVDPTGKANGRGAYLCARPACWHEALRKDRLAHALRAPIANEDRDALRRYAERFEAATAAVEG